MRRKQQIRHIQTHFTLLPHDIEYCQKNWPFKLFHIICTQLLKSVLGQKKSTLVYKCLQWQYFERLHTDLQHVTDIKDGAVLACVHV